MTPALSELLSHEPPQELFHYTSLTGLIGILNSRSIWASGISYLNDASELRLTFDLASKAVDELDVGGWVQEELRNLVECTAAGPGRLFALSLTSRKDQLSQWRGYTTSGAGYSVGFSTSFLRAASKSWGLTLGPCCYDQKKQHQIVREIVRSAAAARENRDPPPVLSSNTAEEPFCHALRLAATFLKHEGFAEEEEWRLVLKGKSLNSVCFRAGASYAVPYVALKFSSAGEGAGEPIRKIVIGPTPNPQLAQDSLSTLLTKNSFKCWHLENSKIPYRSW